MPRWLSRALGRIRELARRGRVRFTAKARSEMDALSLGLSEQDAATLIEGLATEDFASRIESQVTGEPMYVFIPEIGGMEVCLKLILRSHCVVVSFHRKGPDANGQDEES
jgi:hypothetical protein